MAGSAPTIAHIVRVQAATRGRHPLLICDSERISYHEADERSAKMARGLVAVGAGKGTHVGLMYPNGVAFLVGMLAAARIGAVVVPFSTFATTREMYEQLISSDVEILLATADFRSHNYPQRLADVLADVDVDFESDDSLASVAAPQLRHVFISYAPGSSPAPARDIERLYRLADTTDEQLLIALEGDVDGSDALAIVYTSGSTSAPKGVVHTHSALLDHQRNLNAIRGLTPDEKLFCNSPFFWIGGLGFGLLATLVAGSTLVCSNASDAGEVLDLLEAEKPTMTNGFAASIAHLARHPSFSARDLSSMKRGNLYPIMPAARPKDPELRHNMLGMTEAGSVLLISDDEADQPEHRRGSFGKPAAGFETKIIDPDTSKAAHVNEVGELCIRGPYMMQGYYGRSREECFDPDGWFHTGDLVRVDADEFVYYIGRRGAMIKTAGANVSPPEVEKAIAKVTGGTVAHVLGIPDEERGQLVAAVLVLDPDTAFDEAELSRDLKAELSAYKIPKRFARLAPAEVPLLSSGKVDVEQLTTVFDG
jgi:acyl-CoA synthetase (AMP-forming)/AMP-acid ligase II